MKAGPLREGPRWGCLPCPSPAPAALGKGEDPPHVVLGCGSHPRMGLQLTGCAWVSWQCFRPEGDGGGGSHCGKAWEALMQATAKSLGRQMVL